MFNCETINEFTFSFNKVKPHTQIKRCGLYLPQVLLLLKKAQSVTHLASIFPVFFSKAFKHRLKKYPWSCSHLCPT